MRANAEIFPRSGRHFIWYEIGQQREQAIELQLFGQTQLFP